MRDELSELRSYRLEETWATPQAWARARSALAEAMASEVTTPAPVSRTHRVRAWRLRAALTVAGALVLVGVAIAVLRGPFAPSSTQLSPRAAAQPPAARIVLARLARVAATQPPAPAPHGSQYRVTSVESVYPDVWDSKCQLLLPKYRQTWVNARGAGLIRESVGKPRWLIPPETRSCAKMLGETTALIGNGVSESRFPDYCLPVGPVRVSVLRSLPTDPARLRRVLEYSEIEGGPHTPSGAFEHVGELLSKGDVSPRLRAALYRATAGLPGVRSLGRVTDHAGRVGVGLAILDRGRTWYELVFDPATSALMGEQERTPLSAGAVGSLGRLPPGTVTSWAVYYPSRIVPALPPPRPGVLSFMPSHSVNRCA